jgi:hypothetical protein
MKPELIHKPFSQYTLKDIQDLNFYNARIAEQEYHIWTFKNLIY